MLRISPASIAAFLALMPVWAPTIAWAADANIAATPEFFEKKIRPVLVERCQECHGDKKQEGGMRADHRSHMLAKGESGIPIVPGKPEESRLIQVIRYSANDTQMPPAGKLSDEQIADLTAWVSAGAVWPGSESAPPPSGPHNMRDPSIARAEHWAFQPLKGENVPHTTHRERVQTPIDTFILSELDSRGLMMAPVADKRTLLRRMTYDLTGLAPSYNDGEAFSRDKRPKATEELIDRLLASPQYGQRWARHWLDVARYADTKGYVFTSEHRYPYAYTYRDWVVKALNHDMPYDQFVTYQLAADQVDLHGDQTNLAAMGFLTTGRRYLNNGHDIIDDRIDVTMRGLLGLTVACARCHDHKFDAISAEDYYSLYGIFDASYEPEDLPVIGEPKQNDEYQKFLAELAVREKKVTDAENSNREVLTERMRDQVGNIFQLLVKFHSPAKNDALMKIDGEEPNRRMVDKWRDWLNAHKDTDKVVFRPWTELFSAKPEEFVAIRDRVIREAKDAKDPGNANHLSPVVLQRMEAHPPANIYELARLYGELFKEVNKSWHDFKKENAAALMLNDGNQERLRQVLYADGAAPLLSMDDAKASIDRAMRDHLTKLRREIDELKVTSPGAPPRAMVLKDKDKFGKPHVFIRGNPGRPGKEIPRQFLSVLRPDQKPFEKGSGRLELAQSITTTAKPLAARVIANRVWQFHFGTGLVATSSDFGIRGEKPSHPELLDYLAQYLIDHKWSLKALHKHIMMSSVYQQASQTKVDTRSLDPENRLLGHFPRQRLDLEELRDSILQVAGRLDTQLDGRPFADLVDPNQQRRTIYALVNRNDLPGTFRAFDFADTEASAPSRPQTTVPQQALFMINSPFVVEQAKRVAAKVNDGKTDDDKVRKLYRQVLGRSPTPAEVSRCVRFLKLKPAEGEHKLSPIEELAQVLLMTNEFCFVD